MRRSTRRTAIWLLAPFAAVLVASGVLYAGAVRAPIVREARFQHPAWQDAPPVRVLFMSDLHVAGPDMPPKRLEHIVALANRSKADLILIGGDLVSDKGTATSRYSMREATAPLAGLRARFGVFATLGNHDHWRNASAARDGLAAAGVRVLDNEMVSAGPVALVGIGDDFTAHAEPLAIRSLALEATGPVVGFTHSPDVVPELEGSVPLLFAGHTHCGQIRLPLVGALATMSRYGDRFACGRRDEASGTVITSAGLGTSLLPIRFGARPDMWLVVVGP